MKIKANLKQATRYSDDEKCRLFSDGLIRVPSPQKSKKVYTKKQKHKKEW